jgi:glycosyltransferase involved in cell wall biosynthesis
MHQFCKDHSVPFYHIPYVSKKQFPSALRSTVRLLKKIKPEAVHAHLLEGGLIGITAAWLAGVKNRIYTRHHSNYHHKFVPKGLKYDKWVNKRATRIIAITEVVKEILIDWEGVPEEKVTLIHHGFPLENFQRISEERVAAVKTRNTIPEHKMIIGVVSRYTYWKGVHIIIPAFKTIQEQFPNTHLVLANAKGDYSKEIRKLLADLPKDSYTEIIYENDNLALFKCFDIFVHVPVDRESEAFGQIYIEALLLGIPSIFTLSGIANDIVEDGKNALVVSYEDSEGIEKAIQTLIESPTLRTELTVNTVKSVQEFSFKNKISALAFLYSGK